MAKLQRPWFGNGQSQLVLSYVLRSFSHTRATISAKPTTRCEKVIENLLR